MNHISTIYIPKGNNSFLIRIINFKTTLLEIGLKNKTHIKDFAFLYKESFSL